LNIKQRLQQWLDPQASGQTTTLAQPAGWFSQALGAMPTSSGQMITPETALRCTAVWAAVNRLASDVGMMPFTLQKRGKDGIWNDAPDHPLYDILKNSRNPEQTAQEQTEADLVAMLGWGTSFRQIVRSGGQVAEINFLHPQRVRIDRSSNGELRYVYEQIGGGELTLQADEVWRTPSVSLGAINGFSVMMLAREAIALAVATEQHSGSIFRNGAMIATAFTHPGTLSEVAHKNLKESITERFSGSRNSGGSFILEEGMSVQKLSMTAVDSALLDSRKFQVEEIARAFGIPTYKLGDFSRATFSNIEHLDLEYAKMTIMPYVTRLENTAYRDLLLPSERKKYRVKQDDSALLRGDSLTISNVNNAGIIGGWMNRNEARARFGLNPADGLDEFLTPVAIAAPGNPGKSEPDPKG
jgi:HK97 family phage portal protein